MKPSHLGCRGARYGAFVLPAFLLAAALGGCGREEPRRAPSSPTAVPVSARIVSCEVSAQGEIVVRVRLTGRWALPQGLDASPELGTMSVQGIFEGGRTRELQWGYTADPSGPTLGLSLRTEEPPRTLRISGLSVAVPAAGSLEAPSLEQLIGEGFDLGLVRAQVVDVQPFPEGIGIALLSSPLHPLPGLQVSYVEGLRLEVGGADLVGQLLRSAPSERGLLQVMLFPPAQGPTVGVRGRARLTVRAVSYRWGPAIDLEVPPCA